MDRAKAQHLIAAERKRIEQLLDIAAGDRSDDSAAERDASGGDVDGAQPLEHEAIDAAIHSSLRQRLNALDRAEQRVADGTYGKSIESGDPIPDERLENDPAAELTVEEAARHRHHDY